MATERLDTRDEARNALIAALQDNARALRAASARGDKQAVAALQQRDSQLQAQLRGSGLLGAIGGGIASAGVGLLTGIPDLVISGYNSAANPTVPMRTLRERLLEAAQLPTEAGSVQDQTIYSAPEIGTAVAGLAQLGKLGYKGVTSWLKQRKVDNLLSKLPAEEANRFKEYMLRGQGSPNTEVAAKIAELRNNPKYTELFNTLDDAATKAAMSGMAPRASRIEEPQAAKNLVGAVEERLKALRQARSEAGNVNFTKAFEQGGDRTILSPDKTLKTISNLKSQFAPDAAGNFASDSAKSAFNWLTSIEKGMSGVQPSGMGVAAGVEARKLTVKEVQDRLKDWGRNAANEGGVVRDLAIGDEERISKALFGAMKDDLKASTSAATTTADKKALGYLEQARSQTSKASQDYNNLVAQGIPDFLKGKNVADVSFEDLSGAYKNLNPSQRAVFRDWVGQNKAESLQAIDRDVFQAFKARHTGTLPDGTIGTDLKSMAEEWAKMSQKDKDALAAALGQNLNEFNGRMKDALAFTRRLQTGSLATEGKAAQEATTASARVAGATLGYRFNQAVKLIGDTFGAANKGIISDELALKTLLTPEGAAFLKTAKLTPGSQKTLEALTNVNNAVPKLPEYIKPAAQVAGGIAPQVAAPTETTEQPSWELPPETPQSTEEVKWELPPEDVNVQNPELGLNAGDVAPRQSPFTGVNPQLQPY